MLGYTGPASGTERYTLSREKHVEVDGKYADAVLGEKRRRKREGAFYTPAFITRYIVGQALGKTLAERRTALAAVHHREAASAARAALVAAGQAV